MARNSEAVLALSFKVADRGAKAITFEYSVENTTGDDVYLFNQLYRSRDESGKFEVEPDLVYVEIEGPIAHLAKRIPDVPDDVDVEQFLVPCATMLGAGRAFNERFVLPTPITPYQAYRTRPSATAAQVTKADFAIGYLGRAEVGPRLLVTVPTTAGSAFYLYCSPYDQHIATSAPIDLE